MSRVQRSKARSGANVLQMREDRIMRDEARYAACKARVWSVMGPWIMEPHVQATIGGLALLAGMVYGTSPV